MSPVTLPIPPVPAPWHTAADTKLAWRTGYRIGFKTGESERITTLYPSGDRLTEAAMQGYDAGVVDYSRQQAGNS